MKKQLFTFLLWASLIFNIVGLILYFVLQSKGLIAFIFWMPILSVVLSVECFVERYTDKDEDWKAGALIAVLILICNFGFNYQDAIKDYNRLSGERISRSYELATEMCPDKWRQFPDSEVEKCRNAVYKSLYDGDTLSAREAVVNFAYAKEMSSHYHHQNYLSVKSQTKRRNMERNESFEKVKSCAQNWRNCKDLVSERLASGSYNDSVITDITYKMVARYPANQSCIPVIGKCTYNKEKYEFSITGLKKKRLGDMPIWMSDEDVLRQASYHAKESIKTKKGSFKIWGNGTFEKPKDFEWNVKYRILESVEGYTPSQLVGERLILEADEVKTVCSWLSCEKRMEKKFKNVENTQIITITHYDYGDYE